LCPILATVLAAQCTVSAPLPASVIYDNQGTTSYTPQSTNDPDNPNYPNSPNDSQTLSFSIAPSTCGWNISTSSFIAAQSATSGTGNGAFTFFLPPNKTGSTLSGVITITAGSSQVNVPVTEWGNRNYTPNAPLTDVPVTQASFDAAYEVFYREIFTGPISTADCSNYVAGMFCPLSPINRGEAAQWIVRALYGSDSFPYPQSPYFPNDACNTPGQPCYTPYFPWIQKLAQLGITTGCSVGGYCPTSPLLRAEAAVFIVRARLGSATAFDYPSTPYFPNDVPASSPFFPLVQRLALDTIDFGCAAGSFCPAANVTRGEFALFVMRGAFNTLGGPAYKLTNAIFYDPNSSDNTIGSALIPAGSSRTLSVYSPASSLGGLPFDSTTVINPGFNVTGVSFGATTLVNANEVQVTVTTTSAAVLDQPIPVLVRTGASAPYEEAVLPNGFAVTESTPAINVMAPVWTGIMLPEQELEWAIYSLSATSACPNVICEEFSTSTPAFPPNIYISPFSPGAATQPNPLPYPPSTLSFSDFSLNGKTNRTACLAANNYTVDGSHPIYYPYNMPNHVNTLEYFESGFQQGVKGFQTEAEIFQTTQANITGETATALFYFTDQGCSGGDREYGWSQATLANSNSSAQSMQFYYADYTNCGPCADPGQPYPGYQNQVNGSYSLLISNLPSVTPANDYYYHAFLVPDGSLQGYHFRVEVFDHGLGFVPCTMALYNPNTNTTGNGANLSACRADIPIAAPTSNGDMLDGDYARRLFAATGNVIVGLVASGSVSSLPGSQMTTLGVGVGK
jgi:hypothetical protein